MGCAYAFLCNFVKNSVRVRTNFPRHWSPMRSHYPAHFSNSIMAVPPPPLCRSWRYKEKPHPRERCPAKHLIEDLRISEILSLDFPRNTDPPFKFGRRKNPEGCRLMRTAGKEELLTWRRRRKKEFFSYLLFFHSLKWRERVSVRHLATWRGGWDDV